MAVKLKYYFFCLLSGMVLSASSQQSPLDSLKQVYKSSKSDTLKLGLLIHIGELSEPEKGIAYFDKATELSEKLLKRNNSPQQKKRLINQQALAWQNKGSFYYLLGEIPQSLKCIEKALALRTKAKNKAGMASSLNDLGFIYGRKGDIPMALNCFERCIKLRRQLGDKDGEARVLNNIGGIYEDQGDLEEALKNYRSSLAIRTKTGDQKGMANSYNNIGNIYRTRVEDSLALLYFSKSLQIHEKLGNKAEVSVLMNNIGVVYKDREQYSIALNYFNKSLQLEREINDKDGMTMSYISLGVIYRSLNQNSKAHAYADTALRMARELDFPDYIRNAEETMSSIDSAMGNHASAYEHYKQFIIYRDYINNEETRKASMRSQLNYEFEKKEAVLNAQRKKERAIADERNRFQQTVILFIAIGILLVIVFAVMVVRALRTTRTQKIIIEEKQREVLDSIHYARRIQRSLLPSEGYIARHIHQLQQKK